MGSKKTKKDESKFKGILNKLTTVILTVITILVCLFIYQSFTNKAPDAGIVVQKLIESNELNTSEITYKGYHKYADDGLPIINKSNFLMTYTAKAKAGIDAKDVKVKKNAVTKTYTIIIPKAKITNIEIEDKKYYDEHFALFNFNEKEDADKAEKEAKKNAKDELKDTGVLELADKHAEELIKNFVRNLVSSDYKIKVERK